MRRIMGKVRKEEKKYGRCPVFHFSLEFPAETGGGVAEEPDKKKTCPLFVELAPAPKYGIISLRWNEARATSPARYLPYQTLTIIRGIIRRGFIFLGNFAGIAGCARLEDPGNWREPKGNRRVALNSLVYHSMDDQSPGEISLYQPAPTRRLYELFWK